MAKLIFKLRNVPEDEAEDIKQILSEQGIQYYETTAGNWGISMPGLWLQNESDTEVAKNIINKYQQKRCDIAQAEYQRLKQQGHLPTLWSQLKAKPLKFLFYFIFIAAILYVSTNPFLALLSN